MSRKQQIEDVLMALVVSARGPITPMELDREYKTLEVKGLTLLWLWANSSGFEKVWTLLQALLFQKSCATLDTDRVDHGIVTVGSGVISTKSIKWLMVK